MPERLQGKGTLTYFDRIKQRGEEDLEEKMNSRIIWRVNAQLRRKFIKRKALDSRWGRLPYSTTDLTANGSRFVGGSVVKKRVHRARIREPAPIRNYVQTRSKSASVVFVFHIRTAGMLY